MYPFHDLHRPPVALESGSGQILRPFADKNHSWITLFGVELDHIADLEFSQITQRLFLLLLYDKAIACMEEAIQLMDAGDLVAKSDRLIRAQDIVLELSDALDKGTGEIAHNLERIYVYIYRRLIRGNVHMDRAAIAEARELMKKLNSAWQSIILGRDSGAVPDVQMATVSFGTQSLGAQVLGAEVDWRMRA